jgi:hypothetical protein
MPPSFAAISEREQVTATADNGQHHRAFRSSVRLDVELNVVLNAFHGPSIIEYPAIHAFFVNVWLQKRVARDVPAGTELVQFTLCNAKSICPID